MIDRKRQELRQMQEQMKKITEEIQHIRHQ